MIDIIDASKDTYRLGVGTTDERFLTLPVVPGLGTLFDQWFGALASIQAQAQKDPRVAQALQALIPVIQAMWVQWCYVSRESTSLRDEIRDLRVEIADLRGALRKLQPDAIVVEPDPTPDPASDPTVA